MYCPPLRRSTSPLVVVTQSRAPASDAPSVVASWLRFASRPCPRAGCASLSSMCPTHGARPHACGPSLRPHLPCPHQCCLAVTFVCRPCLCPRSRPRPNSRTPALSYASLAVLTRPRAFSGPFFTRHGPFSRVPHGSYTPPRPSSSSVPRHTSRPCFTTQAMPCHASRPSSMPHDPHHAAPTRPLPFRSDIPSTAPSHNVPVAATQKTWIAVRRMES